MGDDPYARLRELVALFGAVEWDARNYSHEPKDTQGVACDAWETFIINPGVLVDDDTAAYIGALGPARVARLLAIVDAARAYAEFVPREGSIHRHAAHKALVSALAVPER